jgi:hypothetical protein
MTIDKRINYRGGGGYRGGSGRSNRSTRSQAPSRSSGPGPGGQGARGQATQNPGRAPRATPVQNVHQTGAVTQTPGRQRIKNVHQTGAVTQTPGRPVQQLGTANQVSTAVTTGGQSPFVHTRPQGITNIDRVKRMISSARDIPWSNLFGFSHAGAAELSEEEKAIVRAQKQKGKEIEKIKEWQGQEADTTGEGVIMGGQIPIKDPAAVAKEIGWTSWGTPTTQGINLVKELQKHKYGDPTAVIPRAPISMEEAIKKMQESYLDPKGEETFDVLYDIGKEKEIRKKIEEGWDLAQVTGQSPAMAANGGLINLFKYGGFLG